MLRAHILVICCVSLLCAASARGEAVQAKGRKQGVLVQTPITALSFLVGSWTGKTTDGATIDETWLPFVEYTTLGTRRLIRNYAVIEYFQIVPRSHIHGTALFARRFDQNMSSNEILVGGLESYIPDKQVVLTFSGNNKEGLQKITYSLNASEQLQVITERTVDGKTKTESVSLSRTKQNQFQQNP